ncbi:MAG: acetyl-CoA C-acetyltransferase [Acidobacteriota bacterium]|nr:acetyl-CoA C-acetyltransferase [Acidobacteriota bacterium]
MSRSVIVAGKRTPIGKLAGAFASLSAQDLGGLAIKAVLEETGVDPATIDAVLMGQVVQAGQGQITARQAAQKGGVPLSVHATTINKVCLSGLQTLHLADLMIRAGEAEIVIAGGMESMTNAPYLLPGARAGYRIGDASLVDSMMFDGLTCAFDHCAMGLSTERYNQGAISRERQDEFSARSHQLAAAAIAAGKFAEEITPVSVAQRKGDPRFVELDEGVRAETTAASLAGLRPAFDKDGTITAGNASQISDGAAALLVMSAERAAALGLTPLGEIISYGEVAGPDTSLLNQPSHAIAKASAKIGLDPAGYDLYEINEAFAAVGLASADDLGLDESTINVNGGAIALGHPIGMSGSRLALTALYELRRRGGGTAAVALCGGGGQGDAAILRSL